MSVLFAIPSLASTGREVQEHSRRRLRGNQHRRHERRCQGLPGRWIPSPQATKSLAGRPGSSPPAASEEPQGAGEKKGWPGLLEGLSFLALSL